MEIIKRRHAKAQGLKFYFTGKACPRNHIGLRLVHNWGCEECEAIRDERTPEHKMRAVQHSRKYRENNPIKKILGYAKGRKQEFDLDLEFIENLITEQSNRCALI